MWLHIQPFAFLKGPKHRQRFLCEVRVPGYNYVGVGNSTSKKDAHSNAARDFVQFLIRQGEINASECPDLQVELLLNLYFTKLKKGWFYVKKLLYLR